MIFNRTIASLALILLLKTITTASSALADEYSKIGSGSLYYCFGVDNGSGGLTGRFYRSRDDLQVTYSKAAGDVNTRIKKLRAKMVRRATSSQRRQLKTLNTTKVDIKACRSNGTTGKADPEHDSGDTSVNACEVVGDASSVSSLLVGGSQCTIGNSPLVYIYLLDQYGDPTSACTGTVVSKPGESTSRYVIFAAHCADGAYGVKIITPEGYMDAVSFQGHPSWSSDQYILEENDVAIAEFGADIPTRNVKVISIDNAAIGETAVLGGFGQDENGHASYSRLKGGTSKLVDTASTSLVTRYTGQNSGVCFGDSGGPIFLQRSGSWVLAGVTSNVSSSNCLEGTYSSFANIRDSSVRSFINGVVPDLIP